MIDVEPGVGRETNAGSSTPNPRLDERDKIHWTRGCCADDHGSVDDLIGQSTAAAKFIVANVGRGEPTPWTHKTELHY